MRIQLDTKLKTIKVDETVNFGELIKYLDKLLPKNHPLGNWKEYKLETNTVINNYNYPIVYKKPLTPYVWPAIPYHPPLYNNDFQITCRSGNSGTNIGIPSTFTTETSSSILNIELS